MNFGEQKQSRKRIFSQQQSVKKYQEVNNFELLNSKKHNSFHYAKQLQQLKHQISLNQHKSQIQDKLYNSISHINKTTNYQQKGTYQRNKFANCKLSQSIPLQQMNSSEDLSDQNVKINFIQQGLSAQLDCEEVISVQNQNNSQLEEEIEELKREMEFRKGNEKKLQRKISDQEKHIQKQNKEIERKNNFIQYIVQIQQQNDQKIITQQQTIIHLKQQMRYLQQNQ